MKLLSPLRYPGGKASLTSFLRDVIDLNGLAGADYYEPYAGGAGAALQLLALEAVSTIHINDIDPRIHAFWHSALNDTDRFINKIGNIPLTLDEWCIQREICQHPKSHTRFDLGFSTFFLNRCNRSGVILGAGPIGGQSQQSKWNIDARFNRESLIARISALQGMRDGIVLTNRDAIDFLKGSLPRGNARANAFVYLDPPYVKEGGRLYYNSYGERDHRSIARYINAQKTLHWLMSYDDTLLIRQLYSQQILSNLPIRYSLQRKRSESELIITPPQLAVPSALRRQAS